MSKEQKSNRGAKKKPNRTMKEKRQDKRDKKKTETSTLLPKEKK